MDPNMMVDISWGQFQEYGNSIMCMAKKATIKAVVKIIEDELKHEYGPMVDKLTDRIWREMYAGQASSGDAVSGCCADSGGTDPADSDVCERVWEEEGGVVR